MRPRVPAVALAALALALVLVLPAAAAGSTGRIDAPEGAPATLFLVVNATGPGALSLGLPAGTRIDTFTLDGDAAAWSYADPATVRLDLPAGPHEARLHAVLPGLGPWELSAPAPLLLEAPGLETEISGESATVRQPGTDGPSPWIAVALAAAVALLVAAALAARDRARGPPPEAAGLLDHLRELQTRLRASLLAVLALLLVFAALGAGWWTVGGVRIPVPRLGEPTIAAAAYAEMTRAFVPAGVQLVVLRPVDAVAAQLWVAVLLAIIAALPVVVYEVASFLAPALLPGERSVALRIAPLILALFAAGAAFAWFLLVPFLIRTLYGFAPAIGATPLLDVPELVSFATFVVLAMGLVFELPVVMAALARAGIVRPATFASKWRHAIVGIFLLAAFVTPDPTVVGQLLVAVPMAALYGIGVAAAYALGPKKR